MPSVNRVERPADWMGAAMYTYHNEQVSSATAIGAGYFAGQGLSRGDLIWVKLSDGWNTLRMQSSTTATIA